MHSRENIVALMPSERIDDIAPTAAQRPLFAKGSTVRTLHTL
jgi:hypothetical protein